MLKSSLREFSDCLENTTTNDLTNYLLLPPHLFILSVKSAGRIWTLSALRGTWFDMPGLRSLLSCFHSILMHSNTKLFKVVERGSLGNCVGGVGNTTALHFERHAMHSHGMPCLKVCTTEELCCFNIWYFLWGPLCDDQRWRQPWNASPNLHIEGINDRK